MAVKIAKYTCPSLHTEVEVKGSSLMNLRAQAEHGPDNHKHRGNRKRENMNMCLPLHGPDKHDHTA
jgi:hypothetical protein